MSQYIVQLIDEMKEEDICFLWMSIGKGELHRQSYEALKKEFEGSPDCYLLEQEFFGSRRKIDKNEVVVVNWEKLRSKNGKTGEWKALLMKDKETVNFRELIRGTRESGIKIIMIIDESHSNSTSERAIELRDDIVRADLTIEMSATPILKERGQFNEWVSVESNDVIEEGMIKKEIIVNENIDKIVDNETTSQELVMEAASAKRLELAEGLQEEGAKVNPLVLIQVPNGEEGESKREFVEHFLAEKNITIENGKLAVWLTEEKVNLEILENNASEVEFLIFKQAIDTGWDCPRAQVLVKFRETKSEVFELQTVGRILRMPEAKHYNDDSLNKAFVYTNIKSKDLDFRGNEYSIKNAIKSVRVERADSYKPIKLRSYYRNRIDFGDITAGFYEVLEDELCEHFGIVKDNPEFGVFETNKKKMKAKGIDIESLENRDEIILNKRLDVKFFDHLPDEKISSEENFQANLSEEDKEKAFENIIKLNIDGFAFKRSLPIVQGALFSWFKKYLNISRYNNGAIFIQNIVLNNAGVFGERFDEAVKKYKPIKDREIKKKIEEIEEWDDAWEIAESRNYNPDTYKPKKFKLSLYQSPLNKKAYLNISSKPEEQFLEYLENHADKISWWWQNGDEHMALNFGIKYGEGSTFQPDFLVMFKNGKVGIYDTKASGFQEDDNKVKAEALQKYIKEENKRREKDLLIGGIVIKEGEHFRINNDDKYESFKSAGKVKENGKKYQSGKEEVSGWRLLKL